MSADTKKTKALELAITQIDRQFGKGYIMRLGGEFTPTIENSVSSGCLSLDVALGVGGVPKGRIIEIYGPESSGKTTLALHIVAEAQKAGGFAAFIDAEHAVDPDYSKNLGVNTEELLISQPDTGEPALEICETLVRSSALDVIVIDAGYHPQQCGDVDLEGIENIASFHTPVPGGVGPMTINTLILQTLRAAQKASL